MQKDHLEILLEDIRGKFDLVLEGHEVLRNEIRETRTELKKDIELSNFKIDILNKKIDGVSTDLKATDERLSKKIDAVAADLKSHRADTEAHHGGVYLVKES
jgi:vacuolar-type H+-ATPase subunit I/STV1